MNGARFRTPFGLVILICFFCGPRLWAGTFSIDSIHVYKHAGDLQAGIREIDPSLLPKKVNVSAPQVAAEIKVDRDALSKNLVAKAYYYDSSGQLIQAFDRPSKAERPVDESGSVRTHAMGEAWPSTLPANTPQSIYFPLPANLPADWAVVIVFGNANGAVAASVPDGQAEQYAYPEKDLVAKTQLSPDVEIDDKNQSTPLIEQVVKSDNPSYPAFTLVMHLPHGITNPKDVKGILATCMVAESVDKIRNRLNSIKAEKDRNLYYAFAEAHQMAVIAWGARWVWKSDANFDELDSDQIRTWDDNFEQIADAWDHGIQLLVDNYGIPDHDYLMFGASTGGEWVHRLALHKPQRFLAVQMHISTSYDAPTPEAARIMWLLTTGEMDDGCDRARRFYAAARDLKYPIIFKAIIGLGHADSPFANRLGVRFFEYALEMKNKRDAAGATQPAPTLDLSGFDAAPFYGDLMNQVMFAAQDKKIIPNAFLVPLPTREIADAWNQ